MFRNKFIFLIFELNSFLFKRIIDLLMLLSEGNKFLFTFLNVLVIEVETQRLTLLLEFNLVAKEHHLVIEVIEKA